MKSRSREFERDYFEGLLRRAGGNRRLSAKRAQIGYSTLRTRLEELGLASAYKDGDGEL